MRVPMIARWPGKIPAGSECHEVAATFDLLPTFAGLSGGTLPAHRIDGQDIWPLLCGKSRQSPHETFYYFRGGGKLQAVRHGNWKLHLPRKSGRGRNQQASATELYDLAKDVSEENNVADQHPEIAADILARASAFEKQLQDEARPQGSL